MKILRFFRCLSFLAIACLLLACTKGSSTPFTLYLGVQKDGTPFMDWEDALYYKISARQKVRSFQGGKVDAFFGHTFDEDSIKLNLTVKDWGGETYTVEGTYEAKDPFTLTFLGTNEEGQKENLLSFRSGSGKINFKGRLFYTYEAPKQGGDAKMP